MKTRFFKQVNMLSGKIAQLFREAQEEPVFYPLLTYEDVTAYFSENKNREENTFAVKGALFKEPHPDGFLISLIFLDENDNILSGKKIIADALNEELAAAIGENNLLILE